MRAILLLSVFAAVSSLPAHAADDQARSGTWTPPTYGAATIKPQLAKSPLAEGFATQKPGPGTRLLTAAAVVALQNTSFAHVDVVDPANVMGYVPSGNPGRSGDRSFLRDTSMDKGIR